MSIDGRIGESDWTVAQVFDDFLVVQPFTRAKPRYPTKLLLLPKPSGLYVAMHLIQPQSARARGRSPRDAQNLDADSATLFIDFEGLGRTAYEFTVSRSGTQRDSLVLSPTDSSRDWDTRWTAATHEEDDGWSVEWEIPWSIAPEGRVNGNMRTLGFFAARHVKEDAQSYGFPGIEQLGSTFAQDFVRIEVPRYSKSSLDWFPYTAVMHDNLIATTKGRVGLDVLWRLDGQNRFAIALNPDFGQVESDNLVVNFSAIETFFEEKRPFFTEGRHLFDLRTTLNGRLVNTRRIGAAPDAGRDGATDVLAAVQYNGTSGRHEYGVFAAVENNSSAARGRDYLVGRWRVKHADTSFGYLGTYAQRPTLDRAATVQALDVDWRLRPALTFRGQALVSDIHQIPNAANSFTRFNERGWGAWGQLNYQPGERWQNSTEVTYFGRGLDFNDLGFQERSRVAQLSAETYYFIRQYPESHWARNGHWYWQINTPYNDSGDRLVATGELGHFWSARSGSDAYIYYLHATNGVDDVISRGNGNVRVPTEHRAGVVVGRTASGRSRFSAALHVSDGGLSGLTKEIEFNPKWYFTETVNSGIDVAFVHSDGWLLWAGGSALASYKRRELTMRAALNWHLPRDQELRVKLQWVGLAAEFQHGYHITGDGNLISAPVGADDFTLSKLSMQVRYRYELSPRAELYVVYSRGGDGSLDERSKSLGNQLSRALAHKTAEQLFVKFRYRFH